MTAGCGSVQHSMAQKYTPKSHNASNPFSGRQNKGGSAMTHAKAASMFYGAPSVKASFKIGKY